MTDKRRETVRSLILEWDPTELLIHEHLGMTREEWAAFKQKGTLPRDYVPRPPSGEFDDLSTDNHVDRLSVRQRETILRLLSEGMKVSAISRRVGCDVTTIRRYAARLEEANES